MPEQIVGTDTDKDGWTTEIVGEIQPNGTLLITGEHRYRTTMDLRETKVGMETPGQKITIEAFEDFDRWCQEHSEEIEDLTIEQKVDKYAFFRKINSPSSLYRRS